MPITAALTESLTGRSSGMLMSQRPFSVSSHTHDTMQQEKDAHANRGPNKL